MYVYDDAPMNSQIIAVNNAKSLRPASYAVGHRSWLRAVSFSSDSKLLATASNDHTVGVWDVRSAPSTIAHLEGHAASVWNAQFAPNDAFIVSCGNDGNVRLWDIRSEMYE